MVDISAMPEVRKRNGAYVLKGSGRAEIRAFKVMELLDLSRAPLRLRDFVQALQTPTSSMAELLKSMTEAGYLAFDIHTRSYMPTRRVASLAAWVPDTWLRRAEVMEAMQRLSRRCGELIFLGVASDIYVHYTETLPSTLPIRMVVEPDAKRLLVQSGMGWALLSALPDATVEKIYMRTAQLRQVDRREWPLQEVLQRIEAVRTNGFIYSRDTVYRGAGVIAARLPLVQHDRHMALGIAGPTQRLDENKDVLIRMLRSEAGGLEGLSLPPVDVDTSAEQRKALYSRPTDPGPSARR